MIKKILESWHCETYVNTIKVKYDKPTASTIFNGESIFSKIRNKKNMSTFTMLTQHKFGSSSHENLE